MNTIEMMRLLMLIGSVLWTVSGVAQEKSTYVYKTVDKQRLKLDVYTPIASGQKQRPVIIFFHGGGFIIGTRELHKYQCAYFAQKGMVAVSADYRLLARGANPQTEVPKCIMDAKSAVRWVKQHAGKFNIDINRIFLSGASAGGFLATAAALNTDINEEADDLSITMNVAALILFNPAYTPEKRYTPSLLPYISRANPPTILFYGDQDKFKPGGDKFFNSLDKEKVVTEFWVARGETHSFYKKTGWNEETCRKAYNFLVKNKLIKGDREKDVPGFEMQLQKE